MSASKNKTASKSKTFVIFHCVSRGDQVSRLRVKSLTTEAATTADTPVVSYLGVSSITSNPTKFKKKEAVFGVPLIVKKKTQLWPDAVVGVPLRGAQTLDVFEHVFEQLCGLNPIPLSIESARSGRAKPSNPPMLSIRIAPRASSEPLQVARTIV